MSIAHKIAGLTAILSGVAGCATVPPAGSTNPVPVAGTCLTTSQVTERTGAFSSITYTKYDFDQACLNVRNFMSAYEIHNDNNITPQSQDNLGQNFLDHFKEKQDRLTALAPLILDNARNPETGQRLTASEINTAKVEYDQINRYLKAVNDMIVADGVYPSLEAFLADVKARQPVFVRNTGDFVHCADGTIAQLQLFSRENNFFTRSNCAIPQPQ